MYPVIDPVKFYKEFPACGDWLQVCLTALVNEPDRIRKSRVKYVWPHQEIDFGDPNRSD